MVHDIGEDDFFFLNGPLPADLHCALVGLQAGYLPPQTAMPQIGLPQAGNFQLSPQQVMAAQLFLPAEQAEALKSA